VTNKRVAYTAWKHGQGDDSQVGLTKEHTARDLIMKYLLLMNYSFLEIFI
jgi:hypothetical protein